MLRALTQMYDDSLRPLGLHATQFSIVQALDLVGEISQNRLSSLLVIDGTTLSRNLRILREKGWIEVRAGADRRKPWLRLSSLGGRELRRVMQFGKTCKGSSDTRWVMPDGAVYRKFLSQLLMP